LDLLDIQLQEFAELPILASILQGTSAVLWEIEAGHFEG
jgi:hypothetical protein|tara:strand:+ start:118 stop:234 length:117 start_codon:yes stop_codon:yes gene_type:complete